MSVTITTKKAGRGTVYAEWTSTLENPTFYIYLNGLYMGSTKRTFAYIPIRTGDIIDLDVMDSPSELPVGDHPSVFVLTWEPTADTSYYLIQQLISAVWTTIATVYDAQQSIFKYVTARLDDETQYQFRILPVGTNGNQGTPREFSALMVRKPDQPIVAYSLDPETGVMAVSEAA